MVLSREAKWPVILCPKEHENERGTGIMLLPSWMCWSKCAPQKNLFKTVLIDTSFFAWLGSRHCLYRLIKVSRSRYKWTWKTQCWTRLEGNSTIISQSLKQKTRWIPLHEPKLNTPGDFSEDLRIRGKSTTRSNEILNLCSHDKVEILSGSTKTKGMHPWGWAKLWSHVLQRRNSMDMTASVLKLLANFVFQFLFTNKKKTEQKTTRKDYFFLRGSAAAWGSIYGVLQAKEDGGDTPSRTQLAPR